jgi:nitroimidazol reductase NimA-like FMN-containing flavoprotein (pyridoxamine 5'-phosphate oxidase superfamily)
MKLRNDMRRHEKAISDLAYIEAILKKAPVGILSLSDGDTPYSIPVNFCYEQGKILLHCAKEGRKIQILQDNPQACFLIVHPVDVEEKECGGAMNYESVLCSGKAQFSETSNREDLTKLGEKYYECTTITEEDLQKTAMITIMIEEISAKRGY